MSKCKLEVISCVWIETPLSLICLLVILDSHSRYDQSWDWLTTYELATGSGVRSLFQSDLNVVA